MDDDRGQTIDPTRAPLVLALRGFESALGSFARWPWSRRRQQIVVVALYTITEALISHLLGVTGHAAAALVETVKRQQGRHEERLTKLEERVAALERSRDAQSREVGGTP